MAALPVGVGVVSARCSMKSAPILLISAQIRACYPAAVKSALTPLALPFLAALGAHAATLEITIKDAKGAPVEDAVVWAMPKSGPAPPLRRRDAAVGQKDKTFIPFVTVVQTGTPVQFPNQDPIRHHVYSFSSP